MAIKTLQQKITPKLTPMSPYEVYLQQVKGLFDQIRTERIGMSYIPPQMGGYFGQQVVIDEIVVIELTDFEVQ
jgi:hypothetical protein